MSCAEVGAYITLLCWQWENGPFDASPEALERLKLNLSESWPNVRSKFVKKPKNGLYYNRRVEEEREKATSKSLARSESGRKGGLSKCLSKTEAKPKHAHGYSEPEPDKEKIKQKDAALNTDCKAVLTKINELSGSKFRSVKSNTDKIKARLTDKGVDLGGVLKMLSRQWQKCKGTAFQEYFRPETLFGKTKFESYYGNRGLPVLDANPLMQNQVDANHNRNMNGDHEPINWSEINNRRMGNP